ncbi:MAG TPA: hypothetical protein PLV68_16270, partial [Ilumatobacteraceae bacterium]|nr:hypothetical protein [Ilumatobacteraceae bacterium]
PLVARATPTAITSARPEIRFDPNGPRLPGMPEPTPEPVAAEDASVGETAAPADAPAPGAAGDDELAWVAAATRQSAPEPPVVFELTSSVPFLDDDTAPVAVTPTAPAPSIQPDCSEEAVVSSTEPAMAEPAMAEPAMAEPAMAEPASDEPTLVTASAPSAAEELAEVVGSSDQSVDEQAPAPKPASGLTTLGTLTPLSSLLSRPATPAADDTTARDVDASDADATPVHGTARPSTSATSPLTPLGTL